MNLRGIFGSMFRDREAPMMASEGGYGGIGPGMDGEPVGGRTRAAPAAREADPNRRDMWSAKLMDIGSVWQGQEPTAVQRQREAQQAAEEKRQREARLAQVREMAGVIFPDNPRARLLFEMNPEAFSDVLAKALEPTTREPGKVYYDPMTGEATSMPRIDVMGDRYGMIDPMSGEVGYSAPRGPTYSEQTGRMQAETSREVGRGNLGVAQQRVGLERERLNRGGGSSSSGAGAPWTRNW